MTGDLLLPDMLLLPRVHRYLVNGRLVVPDLDSQLLPT